MLRLAFNSDIIEHYIQAAQEANLRQLTGWLMQKQLPIRSDICQKK